MTTDKYTRCPMCQVRNDVNGRWEPTLEYGMARMTLPLLICSIHRERATAADLVGLLNLDERFTVLRTFGGLALCPGEARIEWHLQTTGPFLVPIYKEYSHARREA